MQARRCQGCAAPLPEGPEGEPVRCTFCGLLHDAAGDAEPRVQVHQIQLGRAPRVRGWVWAVMAMVAITTLIPLGAGLLVVWRTADTVTRAVPPSTSRTAVPTSPRERTTADLKDLPAGYHALTVAPPAGGYGAVDPVAALPWALAIAQAWESDARLERIDVSRLRPDGTVNLQDDGEALLRYRFRSASRSNTLRDRARLHAGAEEATGLWVQVKSGAAQVFADVERGAGGDEALPPHPDADALTRVMARPAVAALRGGLPFLQGYLIHLADEGWVWYFSSLANESKPRVRARDGAVWPYRRTPGV